MHIVHSIQMNILRVILESNNINKTLISSTKAHEISHLMTEINEYNKMHIVAVNIHQNIKINILRVL